jgi:DNA-binding SARP family transcriptional activator
MLFAAKSAAPYTAGRAILRQPVLEQAASGGLTLFNAPAGYLLADSLAATLAEQDRPTLWLRLGPEDHDPATFLISLIAGAQRLHPGAGMVTLEQMRRRPGPTFGWPPLFAHLAHELSEALPAYTALVLEHIHHLNSGSPTLGLLGHHLLPALPADFTCILTAHHRLPPALPARARHINTGHLKLDARQASALAESVGEFPTDAMRRAVALVKGRAVALSGLLAASEALGPDFVRQAIARATSADNLLARVAEAWLASAETGVIQSLALTMRLEYNHPALAVALLEGKTPPPGPWLQPLADGWARVRRLWHAPLRSALHAGVTPNYDTLHRTADYLTSQGAMDRAIPLYFELGDVAGAAQAIARSADMLMNLGQWQTLNDWLGQLPPPALKEWPSLIYIGGELAAAGGHLDEARRTFALATTLFTARHDADGACRSLFAESALALRRGNIEIARAHLLAANHVAETAGLAWHQSWAWWQLGCLAARAGELDEAAACFGRAIALTVDDPAMLEMLHRLEALVLRQRDTARERNAHYEAYTAAGRAGHEAAAQLGQLLDAPPGTFDVLLNEHGWSRIPLAFKLPPPSPPQPASRPGLWQTLLTKMGLRHPVEFVQPVHPPLPVDPDRGASFQLARPTADSQASFTPAPLPDLEPIATLEQTPPIVVESAPAAESVAPPEAAEPAPATPTLTAHLLGKFRAAINDHPVENWPSGRGRAVFKYLLIHHNQPAPRDVLMDVFWPSAGPSAARNNLNVALHRIRQSLRALTDLPVVLFEEGAYCLNPALHLWLDVEEFDRHVTAGRQLETAGKLAPAAAEYEVVIGIYGGDFLAEDPYEEWPVLTRERLRVAYLDSLDHLSQIYFGKGQYASCATLCQLMLNRDNCREDAHCRLMQCYSRQGQDHLALRQYQACVEALRAELDVAPTPATTQLFERIGQHKRV